MDILIKKNKKELVTSEIINFTELVKNSNTTLSLNLESKMIDKLNKTFDEKEQHWYVANLYMYMNYHPINDFPINLEHVFKMIGFANKGNAMKTIKSNFVEDEDYKTSFLPKEKSSWGGSGKDEIMLNIDTFKNLCMISKTDKGKEIRKYYVKLETIYNELMKEELEEQSKKIKQLENKPETEGFYKNNGYIYLIKDNSNIGHYKIGLSENPSERVKNLNCGSSTNSLELVKTFETKNVTLSERLIHTTLFSHKIKKQKEWFYISNEELVLYFIKTIQDCITFVDKYTFNNITEQLESIDKPNNIIINKPVKTVEKCIQTDIIVKDTNLDTCNKDDILFNRFIQDSCIIDDLEYISMRELIYQYKTWSKMNNIFNYKNFEQYILSNFTVKKMFNKMFNSDMKCVLGINLNKSFYTFEFKEPFSDFEKFLIDNCIKVPTGKLNRTTLKESYESWCVYNNKIVPKKTDIDLLCKFLNKYFLKDYFFEDNSSYHGWYGITIKENLLKGTGLTSTLCKKIAICKVHKDEPNKIIQEWDSQKEASRDLGMKSSTLKYRLDNKSLFNDVYYLIRKGDISV